MRTGSDFFPFMARCTLRILDRPFARTKANIANVADTARNATRNSTRKGGSIAALVILALAGIMAVTNAGVYKDLTLWGALCFIYAVVNLLSLIVKKKSPKLPEGK